MKRNYKILFSNVEVCGVQVDLIVRDPSGLLLVIEVKSASEVAHIGRRQRARLFRVAEVLSGWEPVELFLALAGGENVELLPVDGLTG